MNASGFVYSERRLAVHVGLSEEDAKFLRTQHLKSGVHFKKEGREIALTLPAIKRIWRELKVPPNTLRLSDCTLEQKKNGAELVCLPDRVSEKNPTSLRVTRIHMNPYVLRAVDGLGVEVDVLVGSNCKFVLGMELPAVPDEKRPGYWRLVGPLPRLKGRWI